MVSTPWPAGVYQTVINEAQASTLNIAIRRQWYHMYQFIDMQGTEYEPNKNRSPLNIRIMAGHAQQCKCRIRNSGTCGIGSRQDVAYRPIRQSRPHNTLMRATLRQQNLVQRRFLTKFSNSLQGPWAKINCSFINDVSVSNTPSSRREQFLQSSCLAAL